MAEAAQVFLVWGVNGWKIVPEEQQPPGTVLKDGVMYTPMTRLNDVFFTKVKVRPKTTIDYVFQVTQKRSRQLPAGTTLDNKFQINHPHRSTVEVWDAIGRQRYSYHSVVVQSGVVEVKALVQGEISPNPLDIGLQWRNLLLLLGFCAVFGIITKRIRFSQLALTLNLLRNETSKLVMFALVNRLFLLFIGYLFYVSYSNANAEYVAFNMDSLKQLGQVIKSFEYGDVGDYINIAQNGYEARPFSVDRQANWAFYPFYPIALKISSFFISNILVCGIVISNIFFLFSVVYLYKLISLDYNKNIAILTSTLMIIFPTSYFLSRPGPEALFILLVTSSLYYARKKQWLLSGILSALSVLTRLQGIFLFLPLIYLYYQQYRNSKEHNWGILSVLLMPVSLLAFMLHLYFLTGNFFASFAIQKAWNQDLSYPFRPILDYLLNHSLISYYGWDLTLISIIFMLLAVILTILMLKNKLITWDYKIYTFLSMLLIVSRNTSQASLRFMLPVFPLYLMLSLLIQNKKFAYNYIFFIFISLQVFYFLSFIYHYNWAAT
ncbi:glycosyltransferase family 39 protein [Brasilonema sp. UFV-L1]|uniref:ArnT family glycosyltransferase n=1 Tax=Brasilonema sp. UFV-L1 TaxID=2234130 RepID=UPI00145E2EAE|nr:glycosyltransferase family 39 protein [Brasilonema sp. UFV-L1]